MIETFRNIMLNTEPDPTFKLRLEEYRQNIDNDFQEEWSKKKFKWFFKKRRQKKLKAKIYRRYQSPIFWIVEDALEDMLPKSIEYSFDNLVDIKDIVLGDKNYFMDGPVEKCIQNIFEASGCSLLKEESNNDI